MPCPCYIGTQGNGGYMIDFHSHILPQVDDGSRSMDESIEMAKMYVKAGFSHVTATPHCLPGTSMVPDPQFILSKIELLSTVLKENEIPLTILQGMEIGIDPGLVDLLKQERILTLGGSNTLLLETPFQQLPYGWEWLMMELKTAGNNVLMAHPERSAQLIRDPDICRQFIDMGLYLQVTWDSFMGKNGSDSMRLAYHIIQNGYVHVMATDSHHAHVRNPSNVNEGVERMAKLIGGENTTLLCRENPLRILQNLVPKTIQLSGGRFKPIKKRSIWSRLFKNLF